MQEIDRCEEQHGLVEVEENVHYAGALGVGLRADGADDGRRDAVAEADVDEEGIDGAEGQLARDGEGLQDADGCRGALDDGCDAENGEKSRR